MNEIDKNVADYLARQKIDFYTKALGFKFKKDFSGDKAWPCDEWQVTFRNESKNQIDTEYSTGIGHRVLRHIYKNDNKAKKDFIAVKNHLTPKTERNITLLLAISEPTKPTPASVLYSLISDSSALDTSFEYWCDDYGYDTDSIRHFNIYQQCCNIGKQMKQVFTNKQIETLKEMLQDY